jgi:hypothetical protein
MVSNALFYYMRLRSMRIKVNTNTVIIVIMRNTDL